MAANRHTGHQGETEAEQPDYSVLSEGSLETLETAEKLFTEFNPQRGLLKDLPQLTLEASAIDQACQIAKNDPSLSLRMLLCMSCVDYEERLQMVYFLHSLEKERTLVIKADLPLDEPVIPSVSHVWAAAEWYEREARDLFGVAFQGNPDDAPLLLYEGFGDHPGRKSYPFYEYREF